MALLISEDCINCQVCVQECQNGAISQGQRYHVIDADRCTECVGHHDSPQCVSVCAVDCIGLDPERRESPAVLMEKFQFLTRPR